MRTTFVIAALASIVLSALPAHGEDKKTSQVLRPEVYDRLAKAQKALGDNKTQLAEELAKKLMKRMRLTEYETAVVKQTLGYIYAQQEKVKLAAKTLQETYNLQALPEQTQTAMLYTIGQLHMAAKNYKAAVKAFEIWLSRAQNPKGQAFYTVAAAYYQLENYRKTASYGERALKGTKKPKDNLLQLLLASYVELKQYKPAIRIISILVERHPERKNNWLQLSAMYAETGDEKRALAVLMLAHQAGLLNKPEEYVQLAQRMLSEELPYEAGQLLEASLKTGPLKMNAEVAKLVATAWLQSRNSEKAAPALKDAAELAKDGELYVRLAQLELEREKWKAAISASQKALKMGGLKSRGDVHLLAGIAHVRLGHQDQALKAFEQASKDASSKRVAQGWIKFLSSSSP